MAEDKEEAEPQQGDIHSEIVSILIHDLRSDIRLVEMLGSSIFELVMRTPPSDDRERRLKEYAGLLLDRTGDMKLFIDDLETLKTPMKGPATRLAIHEVRAYLEHTVGLLRGHRRVSVDVQDKRLIGTPPATVIVDSHALKHMFRVLLDNANRYGSQDAPILVSLTMVESSGRRFLALTVGSAASRRSAKLWQDSWTRPSDHRNGALVAHTLARVNSWRLAFLVRDRPTSDAQFVEARLSLPMEEDRLTAHQLELAFIDDDRIQAKLYIEELQRAGFLVTYFDSAKSYLGHFKSNDNHEYKVIICDLMMSPEGLLDDETSGGLLTGLAIAKAIRRSSIQDPIVIFTNMNVAGKLAQLSHEISDLPNVFVLRKSEFPPHQLPVAIHGLLTNGKLSDEQVSIIRRFFDSLILRPTIFGMGFDLKEMLKFKWPQ